MLCLSMRWVIYSRRAEHSWVGCCQPSTVLHKCDFQINRKNDVMLTTGLRPCLSNKVLWSGWHARYLIALPLSLL
jgi:hypothetical protein